MPALYAQHQSTAFSKHLHPSAVRLIADDLTGACDAAAAFMPWNSVRVWLGAVSTWDGRESVQAFNTDSRNLPPDTAAAAILRCTPQLASDTLIFKKVDSAGRGSIAAELFAAQRALGTELTVFAPTFPSHGRIVRDGVLHIYPATGPGTRLSLLTLFPSTLHSSIAIVAEGSELRDAIATGKQLAICNAETDEDLQTLVQAAAALPQRILYAGSAGLAHALAACLYRHRIPMAAPAPFAATTLTIVGTDHPVTQLQLGHLHRNLPAADLLPIRCEPGDGEQILARFHAANPQALILTGGDTALLALSTLGAHSIVLRGELEPGIPWGILDGGLADGRIVVTKSGGFGSADTLSQILLTLSGCA